VCYDKSTVKFHETYGDYFVVGHGIGNNLRMEVKADIKIGHLTEKVKDHLKDAFEHFAVKEEDKEYFKKQLNNSTDIETYTTNILTQRSGHGSAAFNAAMRSMTLDEAEINLLKFA
jgi:hypothetical protein